MNAQQLKNSILQYAMQGKLVPQDPNDEPAIELIQHVKEEKERLVRGKLLKKEKTSSLIIEEQIPYDLPANWKWTTLGEISIISGGKRIPAGMKLSEVDTGYKYIRVADMKNGSVDTGSVKFISAEIYEKIKNYTISKNDLYITVAGTIGKVGFIPPELDKANLTENANKIQIFDLNKKFIYFMLQSPVIQSQITEVTTKVGQPKLAIIRIKKLMVPLPPNKEQQIIVEKIEKLFERIDSYYQNKKQLDKLQIDFPTKLENSILHYAMQGKLVEQDPSDEPAVDIVKHIREEKEKLVKEKVIRKEKDLPPICSEEIPFDIPKNWEWVRLRELGLVISGGTPKTSVLEYWDENGLLWITPSDMGKNKGKYISASARKISTTGLKSSSAQSIPANSLVYSSRAPIGHINIVKETFSTNQGCKSIHPLQGYINLEYLYYALKFMTPWIQKKASGTTFKEISGTVFSESLIPLAPIEEQKKIVSKIEELQEFIGVLRNK